ncbi:hypothetical protein TNCV_2880241 [Trichonephila clavipes]|uniref:Uncharacterized protein n=1 Tax=Trichonephila clavipes TaxID=2585209 RepID=A0A8X6W2N7_TRICX|nr:hypothetical protein TNCV_2880241 [Trichonephila clavipes]
MIFMKEEVNTNELLGVFKQSPFSLCWVEVASSLILEFQLGFRLMRGVEFFSPPSVVGVRSDEKIQQYLGVHAWIWNVTLSKKEIWFCSWARTLKRQRKDFKPQ